MADHLDLELLLDSRSKRLPLKMDMKVLDLLDSLGNLPVLRTDIVHQVPQMEKHPMVGHLDHRFHLAKGKHHLGPSKELMVIHHLDLQLLSNFLVQEHQTDLQLALVRHSPDLNKVHAVFYLINKDQMKKMALNWKTRVIIPPFLANLEGTILFYPMCQKPRLVATLRNTVAITLM